MEKSTSQKKKKPRINSANKAYPIQDCSLYKLRSKQRLIKELKTDSSILSQVLKSPSYNCFVDRNTGRDIQEPTGNVAKLQKRIADLISRVILPSHFHGAVKNKSSISNAKEHGFTSNTITFDIRKFFPTTTKLHVFNFFYDVLKCEPDIADILSKICTFNNSLPTGSQLSPILSIWANQMMFNEIKQLSNKNHWVMTVYIDDVSISGKSLHMGYMQTIKKIVERHGHQIHPDKTKFSSKTDVKMITGVIINPENSTEAPYEKLKELRHKTESIRAKLGFMSRSEKDKAKAQLKGTFNYFNQIKQPIPKDSLMLLEEL